MPPSTSSGSLANALPQWVPEGAQRYLAHTEQGLSIRELARHAGCHASTVLRQVQKVETRREDPLVDEALLQLGRALSKATETTQQDDTAMSLNAFQPAVQPDPETLRRESKRILRFLCESGAVLAVAEGMEKAVVVRSSAGEAVNTAVTDRAVARALALKDWLECVDPGRVSKYRITPAGRAAFKRMLAEDENRASGFAEAQTPFMAQHGAYDRDALDPDTGDMRKLRFTSHETPLAVLARRRDKDGQPFLEDDLVRAGERLREDFELANMGPRVAQNWDRFLTGADRGVYQGDDMVGYSPAAARTRVTEALRDLGPGLGDVVLRCCCYLEGLENAEKKLGWSARSGKIVLRIALQRLKMYYQRIEGYGGPMIG